MKVLTSVQLQLKRLNRDAWNAAPIRRGEAVDIKNIRLHGLVTEEVYSKAELYSRRQLYTRKQVDALLAESAARVESLEQLLEGVSTQLNQLQLRFNTHDHDSDGSVRVPGDDGK